MKVGDYVIILPRESFSDAELSKSPTYTLEMGRFANRIYRVKDAYGHPVLEALPQDLSDYSGVRYFLWNKDWLELVDGYSGGEAGA